MKWRVTTRDYPHDPVDVEAYSLVIGSGGALVFASVGGHIARAFGRNAWREVVRVVEPEHDERPPAEPEQRP